MSESSGRNWDGRTKVNAGIRFFFWLFRLTGPLAYWWIWPASLFFNLFMRDEIVGSDAYWRRRRRDVGAVGRWFLRWRHFTYYGRVLMDRAFAYLGQVRKIRFEYENLDGVDDALSEGKGLIILSAHVGNWELAAFGLGSKSESRAPVNAVWYQGDHERVEERLKSFTGEIPFNIINAKDGLSASLEIVDALKRGEIVAMHADRTVGSSHVEVDFLGEKAVWPTGPFIVAATTGAPVVFVFANRLGYRRYRVRFVGPNRFAFTSRKERQNDLERWVGEYVTELERVVEEFPFQWHNFYPFWDTNRSS